MPSSLSRSFNQPAGRRRRRRQTRLCSHYRPAVTFSSLCPPVLPRPRLPRPRLRRPIMLYQIPWPFERSRRWTRYTPPLNVNNLSLTSTSECGAAAADEYISVSAPPSQNPPPPELILHVASPSSCRRFVGRINIYKDNEEPVARWVHVLPPVFTFECDSVKLDEASLNVGLRVSCFLLAGRSGRRTCSSEEPR